MNEATRLKLAEQHLLAAAILKSGEEWEVKKGNGPWSKPVDICSLEFYLYNHVMGYEIRIKPFVLGNEINGHGLGKSQRWHCLDGWHKTDLPPPYRPLVYHEPFEVGDESCEDGKWSPRPSIPAESAKVHDGHLLHRTTRPLPAVAFVLGREVNGHVLGKDQAWHRLDGWTEADLPPPCRPLLLNEPLKEGDELQRNNKWSRQPETRFDVPANPAAYRQRTTRPLPFVLGREINGHVLAEGQEWSCSEWKQEDLPPPYRPAIVGETGRMEFWDRATWRYTDPACDAMPLTDHRATPYRTTRPLPAVPDKFPPPPAGHTWHNPHNLKPKDLPKGRRLAVAAEIWKKPERLREVWYWADRHWGTRDVWAVEDGCKMDTPAFTYCLPADMPLQLPPVRVPLTMDDVEYNDLFRLKTAGAISKGAPPLHISRVGAAFVRHDNRRLELVGYTWKELMDLVVRKRGGVGEWEACSKEVTP